MNYDATKKWLEYAVTCGRWKSHRTFFGGPRDDNACCISGAALLSSPFWAKNRNFSAIFHKCEDWLGLSLLETCISLEHMPVSSLEILHRNGKIIMNDAGKAYVTLPDFNDYTFLTLPDMARILADEWGILLEDRLEVDKFLASFSSTKKE